MTDRKKPGVAFWATAGLVVVLVGYPLSLGPAQWLIWNTNVPFLGETGHVFYSPIQWACHDSPRMKKATWWYVGLWVDYNKMPGLNLPPGAKFPSSWETSPW